MPSKFRPTRERKRKVLARNQNVSTTTTGTDSNVEFVLPTSKSERDERREALRAELRAQQSKPSAKKQKRLEKYIDKKLRKEESLDLLKKLAVEKEKHNTAGLQSSKHLNAKKRTFADYVNGQARPQPDERSVDRTDNTRSRQRTGFWRNGEVSESEDSFEEEHPEAFALHQELTTDDTWLKAKAAPTQGSGLAQPLVIGADGLPIIPRRGDRGRKNDGASSGEQTKMPIDREDSAETPWEGFSDSVEEAESFSDTEEDDKEIDPRLRSIDGTVLDALLQELERSDDSGDDEADRSGEDDSDGELSLQEESQSEGSDTDERENPSEVSEISSESAFTSETSVEDTRIKPRVSAFKSWATQQLNSSLGHVPSYDQPNNEALAEGLVSVKPAAGYRIGVQQLNPPPDTRLARSVHVERPQSIIESRSELPILQREQEIMEAIHNNHVVVVKGETGSGKTTQLPQFLFEAGYGDRTGPTPGMIGVTQPRRVAAVSMARRVGEELGSHATKVAHQIRFDSTVSPDTAIKFMTDGILLRELSEDLLLKKYSAIVIDEAHERSVNTDLLIGMLSKIVPARLRKTAQNPDPKPLKVIIMSATLDIDDFLHEKLFPINMRPPVVEAEGRQHRVTTHFALRSRSDYLEETIEKVKRAHKKLPRGGILVFLTGQNEIKHVLNRLRTDLLPSSSFESAPRMHISGFDAPLETDDIDLGASTFQSDAADDETEDIDILVDEEEAEKEFEISDDEEVQTQSSAIPSVKNKTPYDTVHLLPLYSQLPTKEQLRVFEPPPERARLIILATNVAETSLTIPGIRYVFDCGRSKERRYDIATSVQSFEIDYISKASAQQRAGRAGRTGPGHCWRLYSSAVYEQFFQDHATPEILRTPAESIVLQLKNFRYPRPVIEFPFPSPPSPSVLAKAEKLLRHIGALADGGLTALGKRLSAYPLSPRLAKILVSAIDQPKTLLEVILVTASLSVDDIFIHETLVSNTGDEEERDSTKQAYGRVHASFSKNDRTSDVLKILTAVISYIGASNKEEFCQQNFVRQKALAEISQLYGQLRGLVQANNPSLILKDKQLQGNLNSALCKQISSTVASGFIDQIALRYDLHPTPPVLPRQPTRAIDVPYLPLTPLSPRSSDLVDMAIFIHPSSLLSRLSPKAVPEYIVYRHLQTSQARSISDTGTKTKTRMVPLTPLDATTLLSLVRDTGLIEYGKPIPKTKMEDVPNTRPKEQICWVSTQMKSDGTGKFGWPLPPSKVRRVVDLKAPTGWRIIEVIA